MKTEFLFKLPHNRKLLSFQEIVDEMTEILSEGVVNDFKEMDKVIIEIYDNRQAQNPGNQWNLGKMPLPILIQKFR